NSEISIHARRYRTVLSCSWKRPTGSVTGRPSTEAQIGYQHPTSQIRWQLERSQSTHAIQKFFMPAQVKAICTPRSSSLNFRGPATMVLVFFEPSTAVALGPVMENASLPDVRSSV